MSDYQRPDAGPYTDGYIDPRHDPRDPGVAEQAGATVTPIGEGPTDFDLDAREVKTIRPYRLKFQRRWWVVEQPDIGTIMDAENAPDTESFMALMFEDQWPHLREAFRAYQDPAAIFEIARAISAHFDLDTAARPRNRRERRASPRRA